MDNGTQEGDLERRLEELKEKKAEQTKIREQGTILRVIATLPTPIAKASLFKGKIGLIPDNTPKEDLRTIIKGYLELNMYREAGAIEAYHLNNYEDAIKIWMLGLENSKGGYWLAKEAGVVVERYLKDEKRAKQIYERGLQRCLDDLEKDFEKGEQRKNVLYWATHIAKELLHDLERAKQIMIQYGEYSEVIQYLKQEGDLKLALRISEEQGQFSEARYLADQLGDITKSRFYKAVQTIVYNAEVTDKSEKLSVPNL